MNKKRPGVIKTLKNSAILEKPTLSLDFAGRKTFGDLGEILKPNN
jgi:hypothetical protein